MMNLFYSTPCVSILSKYTESSVPQALGWLGLGSHSEALLTDSQAAPLPFRIHLGLAPWFSAAHGDAVGMFKALSYPKHMGTQPLTPSTREAGSRGHWILGRHMKKGGWKERMLPPFQNVLLLGYGTWFTGRIVCHLWGSKKELSIKRIWIGKQALILAM